MQGVVVPNVGLRGEFLCLGDGFCVVGGNTFLSGWGRAWTERKIMRGRFDFRLVVIHLLLVSYFTSQN